MTLSTLNDTNTDLGHSQINNNNSSSNNNSTSSTQEPNDNDHILVENSVTEDTLINVTNRSFNVTSDVQASIKHDEVSDAPVINLDEGHTDARSDVTELIGEIVDDQGSSNETKMEENKILDEVNSNKNNDRIANARPSANKHEPRSLQIALPLLQVL